MTGPIVWIAAGCAAALMTAFLRPLARSLRFVSHADPHRSGPGEVPLLGGLAVLAGVAAGALLYGRGGAHATPGVEPALLTACAAAVAGFALLGLVDDRAPLPPQIRLALELALSAALLAYGLTLLREAARAGAGVALMATLCALAAALLTFLANACNMADNADGLAAGTGLIAFLGLALLLPAGTPRAIAFAASGALAGFLAWNWPPARCYLGDCGTLPLGLLLALLAGAVVGTRLAPGAAGLARMITLALALALILGYILFDPVYAIISRLRRRRAPWVGGVDHPSHRLASVLGNWPRALRIVLVTQAVSVALGVLVLRGSLPAAALLGGLALWIALLGLAGRGAAR